jgi:hypothetical protein
VRSRPLTDVWVASASTVGRRGSPQCDSGGNEPAGSGERDRSRPGEAAAEQQDRADYCRNREDEAPQRRQPPRDRRSTRRLLGLTGVAQCVTSCVQLSFGPQSYALARALRSSDGPWSS